MRRLVMAIALLTVLAGSAAAFWGSGGGTVNASGGGGVTCNSGTTPVASGQGCNFSTLTSAQIKALDLTPVTIVAAPGAGKAIQVLAPPFVQYKFGTTRYVTQPIGAIDPAFNYGSINTATPTLNLLFITDTVGTPTFSDVASNNTSWQFNSGNDPIPIGTNQPMIIGVANPTKISYNLGPITAMTVANGGGTYNPGDTFTIDAAGAFNCDTNDATGHVLTAPGGVVGTVAINTAGLAYCLTTANVASGPYPTHHTSGAGNDALTVNVTGVTAGDGTAVVTVLYQTITLQ